MPDHDWPQSFEEILHRHLPFADNQPLNVDDGLADLGLDSLGTVALLLDLEEGFVVTIPDNLLVAKTFATVGSLWSVIAKLQPDVAL
jgi:acyl carrier protein